MLKQEDMLNRETSAKQVAVFSAAVVTCISKHFAKSAFRDRARSFFRKCFTFLRVFLAGCWREPVSFNPGVYLVRGQSQEAADFGDPLSQASKSMAAWHPRLLVWPSWSHFQCLAQRCLSSNCPVARIFLLFFTDPQHSQNYQNHLWNGLTVPPLSIPISQSQNPNASLGFPGPRSAIQCRTKTSNFLRKKNLPVLNNEYNVLLPLCHTLSVITKIRKKWSYIYLR